MGWENIATLLSRSVKKVYTIIYYVFEAVKL